MKLTRDECGGAGELVVLTPLVLLVLGVIVLVARLGLAGSAVSEAAGDAADAAAVAPNAAAAQSSATQAAESDLDTAGLHCSPANVGVTLGGFAPGGVVSATVACTVSLASAGIPGLPGTKTLTGQASSPIDVNVDGAP